MVLGWVPFVGVSVALLWLLYPGGVSSTLEYSIVWFFVSIVKRARVTKKKRGKIAFSAVYGYGGG